MKPTEIIQLIDLTQLPDNHAATDISKLINMATTPLGPVAALCVYPEFIETILQQTTDFKIATVCNFPKANNTLEESLQEIAQAIAYGANEIDLVMPYHKLIAGDIQYCQSYLQACREACGDHTFKVIIESGELKTDTLIKQATQLVVTSKADFVKTSTGKTHTGATLDAATAILKVLAQHTDAHVGLKISGGIANYATACQYLQLVGDYMGHAWITAANFRIGASRLLNDILDHAQ